MLKNNFQQRKKDVLSRMDKSSKGEWDEKIAGLCDKINSLENYYTTSSCAGRAVLIVEKDKKEHGLFVKVYHDLISLEGLKKDLDEAVSKNESPQAYTQKGHNQRSREPSVEGENLRAGPEPSRSWRKFSTKISTRGIIKFKMEPCALHVACESLEDAQKLYDKAKLAGWKRSGIIASRSRFMVELNSTEKLEFPIIQKNKILVDNEFLNLIVEESNRKLEKSWEKIGKLSELISKNLD